MNIIKYLITPLLIVSSISHAEERQAKDGFVPLFDGTSLEHWRCGSTDSDTDFADFVLDDKKDVIHLYKGAKDGSKQKADVLYTKKAYSHYILKLEYKWGEKKYAPRAKADRDAGLLFHMIKDFNKIWPNCLEMQLGDSDVDKEKNRYTTGDLWIIGKEISAETKKTDDRYDKRGELIRVGLNKTYANCYVAEQKEKRHGQWNQIELHVHGSEKVTYILNGTKVLELYNIQLDTDEGPQPLGKGRIGLQAEYAEAFYRNIYIKELPSK